MAVRWLPPPLHSFDPARSRTSRFFHRSSWCQTIRELPVERPFAASNAGKFILVQTIRCVGEELPFEFRVLNLLSFVSSLAGVSATAQPRGRIRGPLPTLAMRAVVVEATGTAFLSHCPHHFHTASLSSLAVSIYPPLPVHLHELNVTQGSAGP